MLLEPCKHHTHTHIVQWLTRKNTTHESVSHTLSQTPTHFKSKEHRGVTGPPAGHCCCSGFYWFLPPSSDRQEGPPGQQLGGGLWGPPAETAKGETDAEGNGRVFPREVKNCDKTTAEHFKLMPKYHGNGFWSHMWSSKVPGQFLEGLSCQSWGFTVFHLITSNESRTVRWERSKMMGNI